MVGLKVRFSNHDMAALEAEARGKNVALAEVVRQAVAVSAVTLLTHPMQ